MKINYNFPLTGQKLYVFKAFEPEMQQETSFDFYFVLSICDRRHRQMTAS